MSFFSTEENTGSYIKQHLLGTCNIGLQLTILN